MDVKTNAKKAVLEEIMKLMDDHMGEGLKSKSPKFMSVEVEAKPEDTPEGDDSEMLAQDDEAEEMPVMPGDDESDEEKLKRLYQSLR
jgi:hypothetical protein